jgi:glycerophosphoryl diester phosphodiesterase
MRLRRALSFVVGLLLTQPAAGSVLVIGHRGNDLFAPENTVASFAAALGKADYVEFDGRLSSDGVLVVMHDDTVDRTTDGTGTIASKTLAQLQALDAGSWFSTGFTGEHVPTLAQAVETSYLLRFGWASLRADHYLPEWAAH